MSEQWKVGSRSEVKIEIDEADILPHWEEAKVDEKTSKGQRVWAERYNALRNNNLKYGLMKQK